MFTRIPHPIPTDNKTIFKSVKNQSTLNGVLAHSSPLCSPSLCSTASSVLSLRFPISLTPFPPPFILKAEWPVEEFGRLPPCRR